MEKPLVHVTPYGRPAAQLLRDRIAGVKREDPLAPVTVVVPTNYVSVSTRRLLASGELGPVSARGRGVAGLALLTVWRLAELLGAPRLAAAGRRPVSTPVVAAAVRRVLAEAPGLFGPVREHPATEEALVRVHRELSVLAESTLDRLAAASPRASDVVRVHRTVRAALVEAWFEEVDLMGAAVDALAEEAPASADLGTVLVYLPQDLSLPAAGLLRSVAAVAPVEVIAALTGVEDADRDVLRTLRRLGAEPPPPSAVVAPTATAVVSVSDPEEEVRTAVERIVHAARDGVPLERMAILYPAAEPYGRIVHDQLTAAGIAYNGRAVRPLHDRLVGRWLLDLLELADRDFARSAVMGLLSEAPVRGAGGRFLPTTAWERISRDAGVVRGRSDWRDRLGRYADQQRQLAADEAASAEARKWLVDRLTRDAGRAEELALFVAGLIAHVDAGASQATWAGIASWAKHMARRYLGSEGRRDAWPEVERDAADRVEEALDRLAGLDQVEPAVDLATFQRTLRLELDAALGRVGELGQGVLVGRPAEALGVDLDVVVVFGLAEGVFPTHPREDSLLPDRERRLAADELTARVDRVAVEHRQLLAALAAADGERAQRVLTYPSGDLRRSIERAPSRWLLDSVERLRSPEDGVRSLQDGLRSPEDGVRSPEDGVRSLPPEATSWFEPVPSFAGRVRAVGFPATRQEFALRALSDVSPKPTTMDGHPLVTADPVLRRGVELLTARRGPRLSRFDGDLSGVAAPVPSPADPARAVSATQLESWLKCPHAYLLETVLRVAPVEDPEEQLEISPLEKGSLVHDVLERWLCEQLASALPPPGRAWPEPVRRRMRELAEQACDDAEASGVTGHPLLWQRERRRIIDDLARFVTEDDRLRELFATTPAGAELPFGLPGAAMGPVEINLGDGRRVRVRGRIDRVDRADGHVVVLDYKTGRSLPSRALSEEQPLGDGTMLQLPIYGLAARAAHPGAAVEAYYWFVTWKGEFAVRGYPVTEAVVERLRAAVRLVVDGIEAGLFPMRPAEPAWRRWVDCVYCDPDGLGTADRYRDWIRKRTDPRLAGYLAHVEPDAANASNEAGHE